MLSDCDKLAICLEQGKGLFSLESSEANIKYLKALDKEVKRFGINATFVPARLKFLCKKFFKKKVK